MYENDFIATLTFLFTTLLAAQNTLSGKLDKALEVQMEYVK